MGSQSLNEWSRYEVMAKQEDEGAFTFPTQLAPLDFSGYSGWDCHYDLPMQESVFDALPLMESFSTDPLCSALDLAPNPNVIQEDFWFGYGNGVGIWNHEMGSGFEPQNQPSLLLENNGETPEESVEEKVKRRRDEEKNSSKTLSRNTISQYFYMPITQAAKELNVGLTLLKKRCRELGIRRWPHRKLMSLQTLIKNVQELDKEEGEGADVRLREAIDILEQERKLMEEVPDLQLEDKTKRLRQACFKANYKKRKLMGMMDPHSNSSSNYLATTDAATDYRVGDDDDEEEEMRSLLSDCFSSSNYEHMMLLDLLKKGHPEPEKKIGEGILAFQVRYHPQWRSRCFFIIRNDESTDDFSFRKCVDHILPLPEDLKIKSDVNKALGGGGGGHRGKAGGSGRGGGRGFSRGRGRGRGGKSRN